ncbi:hypothetical protein V6N13_079211 [Hibiscus sabdariffa]
MKILSGGVDEEVNLTRCRGPWVIQQVLQTTRPIPQAQGNPDLHLLQDFRILQSMSHKLPATFLVADSGQFKYSSTRASMNAWFLKQMKVGTSLEKCHLKNLLKYPKASMACGIGFFNDSSGTEFQL